MGRGFSLKITKSGHRAQACPRKRIGKGKGIDHKMRLAHSDHEHSFAVLRNVSIVGGVQDSGVSIAEPVTGSLDLGLDAFERPPFVTGLEVPDILEEQNLRFLGSELSYDSDNV